MPADNGGTTGRVSVRYRVFGMRGAVRVTGRFGNACALAFAVATAATAAGAECRVVPQTETDITAFEAALNETRRAAGLAPLRADEVLYQAAQAYACSMADSDHFDHVAPDGSEPWDRADLAGYGHCSLGENLAVGMLTLAAADLGWRNSPGHFANYVSVASRDYAIAAAIGVAPVSGRISEPSEDGSFGLLADRFGGEVTSRGPGRAAMYWVMLVGSAGC